MLILNILLVFWFNDKVLNGDFLKLGLNWIAAPNGTLSYSEIKDNKGPSRHEMNKEELLSEFRKIQARTHGKFFLFPSNHFQNKNSNI